EEATVSGDPDLDLIDAAFDDAPQAPPPPPRAPAPPAPPRQAARPAPSSAVAPAEDDFSGLTAEEEGPTVVQFSGPPAVPESAPEGPVEDADSLVLAPGDLVSDEDDQARAFAAEVQAAQEGLGEAVAGAGGAGEGDEMLRLHAELHAAEQRVGALRAQHAQGEQRELELQAELARRDGQLKSLQARLDQAVQEKRRLEQALQGGGQADADEARRGLEGQLAPAQGGPELKRGPARGAGRQGPGPRRPAARGAGAPGDTAESG